MTSRILPPDEWPKLAGTELEAVWPVLNADATVLVVEDEGRIVGCWAILTYVHVEGLWIAPAYRKQASVGRRLWFGMLAAVRRLGADRVITGAMTQDVRDLITSAGGALLPGDQYVLAIGRD